MKTQKIKKIIVALLLLLSFITAEAGLYIDGGLSYRRTDNAGGTGTSDTVSITDIVVGYSDKLHLPLGMGNAKDKYDINVKYRQADYSRLSQYNYTQWQLAGSFRKFLQKQWWLLFSGDYLLLNSDDAVNDFDRLSLSVENGYRLTNNLLLTAAYLYRNTSYDSVDNIDVSHGYSVGARYDFGDMLSLFAKYTDDQDYIDSLGVFIPDARIKTTQAGILLAVNQRSALRLMYQYIDDGVSSHTVTSTDFVLRY